MSDGKALYGLTENAPGAYPLTYVNDIFVPDSGLSVDQTNGVATLMRVQAGAGQDLEFALGEGKLPADLTQKTLDGADQVVKANCKGDDRSIQTVTGGGQFWPKSVAPPAKSLVCVATPHATNTSGGADGDNAQIADGSSGDGALGSSSSGDLASSSAVDGATSPAASDAVSAAAKAGGSNGKTAGGGSAEGVLAEMPLPPPSDGRYLLDRLSTLMLGGAAFLVVRKILRSRAAP